MGDGSLSDVGRWEPVVRPEVESPFHVYLASLAPGSRATQRASLESIARLLASGVGAAVFPWERLRYADVAALRAVLADRHAPATANRALAAVKGVLRAAWRLETMDAEHYQRAVDVEPVRGTTAPVGRALDHGELRALFAACAEDGSAAGARDAALLALLAGAGLRRFEPLLLDLDDYTTTTGELRVKGKGATHELVYLTNGAAEAVAAWLALRGEAPGPLLCPVLRGGRVVIRRITEPTAVSQIVSRRAAQSNVRPFTPHDLRRTYISELWDGGSDASAIRSLARHRSADTTMQYDRRGERAKIRAAQTVHMPYIKPSAASSI